MTLRLVIRNKVLNQVFLLKLSQMIGYVLYAAWEKMSLNLLNNYNKMNQANKLGSFYYSPNFFIRSNRPIFRSVCDSRLRSSGLYQKKNCRWASFSFVDSAENTGCNV